MMLRNLTVCLIALVPLCAHAQFKCLARDGVTEYRSTPCPSDAKPLNNARITPGPSSTQQEGPNYWQREAARLERTEARERAEQLNAQRAADAANQAELDRKQAAIDRIAAEKRERAAEAARNRPVICSTRTIDIGSGLSHGTTVCQ